MQMHADSKQWIAVFDLKVTKNSPGGSCVLAEVLGLADEFEITVFSDAFDNDDNERVEWVRVALPPEPVFLRYILFNFLAARALHKYIARRGSAPVLIQATEGQFIGADICYPHFCHRAYLKDQWQFQKSQGLRRMARWVTHRYNASTERLAFLKASLVISPSRGLARELTETYPFLEGRVFSIPNPVDIKSFARPEDFDRTPLLTRLGQPTRGKFLCFAALGDFSRKGLGLVLEALAGIDDQQVRLLVVGGNAGEIAEFVALAQMYRLTDRVAFTGYQSDVRPYLWSADLFVLPSSYEISPLVVLQAMGAGVPVVATRLYGVEEYVEHGANAWFVERSPDAVRAAIVEALSDPGRLRATGLAAKHTVSQYDRAAFVAAWRKCMRDAIATKLMRSAPPDSALQ